MVSSSYILPHPPKEKQQKKHTKAYYFNGTRGDHSRKRPLGTARIRLMKCPPYHSLGLGALVIDSDKHRASTDRGYGNEVIFGDHF